MNVKIAKFGARQNAMPQSVKLVPFLVVVIMTMLSAISGCEDAEVSAQSSTQPATQPATQAATQPARPVAEAHGTFGEMPKPAGDAIFIHMVTSMEHDDNPACVAFNAALAALKQGRPVVMFYDAGAVTDLKLWKGDPTALRYPLPNKLNDMLSQRYGVAPDRLPQTYQEYLYALRDAGATIAANGFMAQLVSLTDDATKPGQLEPIIEMWSLERLLDERSKAATYLRY